MTTAQQLETRHLKAALRSVGLTPVCPTVLPPNRLMPTPTLAGDTRTEVNSIQAMRRQRDG